MTKVAAVKEAISKSRIVRMAQSQAPRFLIVAEVANFPRVSKMMVYRMAHADELPAVRVKRSSRVPLKAVEEFSESNLDSWVIGDESEATVQ